jgi:hypothetical protein
MNSVTYKYNIGESVWGIDKNKIFCAVVGDVNIHVSKAGFKVNYGLLLGEDSFSYATIFKQEGDLFLTKQDLIKNL